MIQYFHFRRK